MKIVKEVTVTLTPKEVEEIIKKHLMMTQGLDVSTVRFDVGGHNQEDDWRAEYPLEYRLDNVICNGILDEQE